jgi:uncharacterized protein with FMN-binding domain
MPEGGNGNKIGCGLAFGSSTAIFAVFLAGNLRTESAVDRFARDVAEQRVAHMASRRVRSVQEGLNWASGAPKASAPPSAAEPKEHWKDGTYTGWGFSRHGDIEATVTITRGHIQSAAISQCRTRYSCGVIEPLPGQVVERQSPDVDYVSGATQSADAFYEAVVAALQKAKA